MSLIPSIFGGRRSNIFDPFSPDIWDPWEGFPISNALTNIPSAARETSDFANTRIDWKETPEAHVFTADLPGIKKGGTKGGGGRRKSSSDQWGEKQRAGGGERQMAQDRAKQRQILEEIQVARERAKIDGVKANMENGVLTVTVPKEEVKKPEIKSVAISG